MHKKSCWGNPLSFVLNLLTPSTSPAPNANKTRSFIHSGDKGLTTLNLCTMCIIHTPLEKEGRNKIRIEVLA